jgi:hypothetical protein
VGQIGQQSSIDSFKTYLILKPSAFGWWFFFVSLRHGKRKYNIRDTRHY